MKQQKQAEEPAIPRGAIYRSEFYASSLYYSYNYVHRLGAGPSRAERGTENYINPTIKKQRKRHNRRDAEETREKWEGRRDISTSRHGVYVGIRARREGVTNVWGSARASVHVYVQVRVYVCACGYSE